MPSSILFLCKKMPFPPKDGESIVIAEDAKILKKAGYKIHFLCFNTLKHFVNEDPNDQYQEYFDTIESISIDTTLHFDHILSHFQGKLPIQLARFESNDFRLRMHELILTCQINMVIAQGLAATHYLKDVSADIRRIYRVHNIEHLIWRDFGQSSSAKRLLGWILARSLHRYEIGHLKHVDQFITLSHQEEMRIKELGYPNVTAIPITLSYSPIQVYNESSEGILFVGSLDWAPNREGLDWFIQEIYPRVFDIPLTVAGRGSWTSSDPNITILTNFESLEHLFSRHRLVIVPLLSGAGIRIKILECLQAGIPVISTTKGAEGILSDSTIYPLCDDPQNFADMLKSLYHNSEKLMSISKMAKTYFQNQYSEDQIASYWKNLL
jgi:glycosyltransferase involved in cell wall biosynthesis